MDREKIIKGLKQFKSDLKPFCGNHTDWEKFDGVFALLKEQEAKRVNISQTHCGMKYGLCPRCEKKIDTLVNPHYCGNCGQELKWE